METSPNPDRPTIRPSRIAGTLKALMRTRITTGLLVVLPVYITLLLISFVFSMMRDASLWVIEAYLRGPFGQSWLEHYMVTKPGNYDSWSGAQPDLIGQAQVPFSERIEFIEATLGHTLASDRFFELLPRTVEWGASIFAVLLTFSALYIVGLFAANIFGRRLIEWAERLVDRVPLVKTVYRSTKQILATFAGEQAQEFQRAALVPFPQERMRCVGFITSIFKDSITGEELASVFIPTTPNPTTGYLQILRRKDLVELDWSVEDAVRTIMSGGILRPDFLTIVPNKGQNEKNAAPPKLEGGAQDSKPV